jgi:hypothetical protein
MFVTEPKQDEAPGGSLTWLCSSLLASVRLGCKGLQQANTLAYWAKIIIYEENEQTPLNMVYFNTDLISVKK